METILEQQRRLHEERERVVDTIVKEWISKKTSVSRIEKFYCSLFIPLSVRLTFIFGA